MASRSLKQIVIDREPRAQTFYDELFYSPEVCSHCFERIRDLSVYHDLGRRGGVLGTHETEYLDLLPAAIRGADSRQKDEYGAIQIWHGQTYCGECGRTAAAQSDRYHLSELMDAAPNICDRLQELGHDISVDRLRDAIRALKTESEVQGHDTEVLAWATGRALREADRDRPTTDPAPA